MQALSVVAPKFVEMAHRIVWCVGGHHRRRWAPADQSAPSDLGVGRSVTDRLDRHVAELAEGRRSGAVPELSVTYWSPNHDTCTADCSATFESGADERAAGWNRFANGPEPVGYDPAIIPGWDSPESPEFGVLRLTPHRLRVMPGTVMLAGQGETAHLAGVR